MSLRDRLRADVRAILDRDPAASSAPEAVLTSPGLWTRWSHRLASWLWARDHRLVAGVVSTLVRLVTGIEIHPGATVGERVVIDHGQGTVIGETATVGDDALLYHGVTLGSKAVTSGERHPTVGDAVTLGANATVLGNVTVGDGATVGAGAVVVDDVDPGATVVGVPAERVDAADDDRSAGEESASGDLVGRESADDPVADSEPARGTGESASEAGRTASEASETASDAGETDADPVEPVEEAAGPVCEAGSGW